MRVLLLPLCDELYAVELESLLAVVAEPHVFAIPTAPKPVLGSMNVRGEIIAVLDTADVVGIGRLDDIAFAAVIDHPLGTVALAAEGRPVTAQLGQQVAPADLAGAVGTFRVNTGVATLLDVRALLVPAAAA